MTLPLLLVAGLVIVAAQRVVDGQRDALRALDARFHARAESAADFVAAYTDDLADRQQERAMRLLSAPEVSAHDFTDVVATLDVSGAVLFDSTGAVLHVHGDVRPDSAVGRSDLPPHVRSALGGTRAISNVLAATERGAVIGIAVPIETPAGRRVLDVSYPPEATPLGRFLDNAVPLRTAQAWLVDSHGALLANSGPWDRRARLDAADPDIPPDALSVVSTDYRRAGEARHLTGEPVAGTPWRLVETVSHAVLHAPVRNSQMVPRVTLVALFATALFALLIFWRLLRSEVRLAAAVSTDVLTGLLNRRSIEAHLRRMAAGAARRGRPMAVLLVDIDHFKRVNDTVGHQAGDDVLVTCAARMAEVLRENEVLGRWGGEEFLVLLPEATIEEAQVAAERVRRAVHHPVLLGDRAMAPSVSIGIATTTTDDAVAVLREADLALYEAKARGRNRVEVATGSLVEPAVPMPAPA